MTRTIIEKGVPLSSSKLWTLLKKFYTQHGLDAWNALSTPFYITSTPFLAKRWASIVFSYFKESNADQYWIFEVGAGSGRFAYLFCHYFEKLMLRESSQKPWRYVMLDVSPSLIPYWQGHPKLKNLWERGKLDAATFDIETDSNFRLLSGQVVEGLDFPCAVLGGYLFDSIPAESYIKQGSIKPYHLTVEAECGSGSEIDPYEVFQSMNLLWQVDLSPYVSQLNYQDLFDIYERELFEGCSFTLPLGAEVLIKKLQTVFRGGYLLLTGDQGYGDIASLNDAGKIELGRHGSFSCPVNYHGLQWLLEEVGVRALLSKMPSHKFVELAAFVPSKEAPLSSFPHTQKLAQEILDSFDNENYYQLTEELLKLPKRSFTLNMLLLKLGSFDPVNFFYLLEELSQQAPELSNLEKRRLLTAMREFTALFYPVTESDSTCFEHVALLAKTLKSWQDVAFHYERAFELYPHRADFCFKWALALYQLSKLEEAAFLFNKAESLDPLWSLSARLESIE